MSDRVERLRRAAELALPQMERAIVMLRDGAPPQRAAARAERARGLEHARRILARAANAFLDDTQPIDLEGEPS